MTDAMFLWRAAAAVPADARLAVEEMLETRCVAVSSMEIGNGAAWTVEGFIGAEPDREAFQKDLARVLAACGYEPECALKFYLVPPRDWLAENLISFPPLHIGRYFIHGSHVEVPQLTGAVTLHLDPGTAFGSGEHATTAGCLMALDTLAKSRRFQRPLDMGCGSGILALAMAKTWRVPVVASDIDPESTRVTRLNARQNGVGHLVRPVCGRGYRSQAVARSGPYDLIVANILARPLIKMAGDLVRHLRPARQGGGTAILSGLLARDARWVGAAHQARGLRLNRTLIRDGWATLVLSR